MALHIFARSAFSWESSAWTGVALKCVVNFALGQQSQTELRLYFGVCILQQFQQSSHRECVCLYKHHLRCKTLVGNTQTRELHPVDAGDALLQPSPQLLPQCIQCGSSIRIHALVQAAGGVPEGRTFSLRIGKGCWCLPSALGRPKS